jgi:hypothetical protein
VKDAPSTGVVTKLAAIAIVGFGLAYACLWWSFQRFYSPFGVSPDDVGLGPSGSSTSLPGAALQLGIWLLIALTILAALPTLAVVAGEIAVSAGSRAKKLWALAASVLLLGCSAYMYHWLIGTGQGLVTLAIAALVFAALGYGLGRAVRALTGGTTGASPPVLPDLVARIESIGTDRDPAPRIRLAFGIFLTAAVVGLAFLDLPSKAEDAAKCAIKAQGAVPELNIRLPGVELPILNVHAEPATLSWLTLNPPPNVHTSGIVYLGQGNGGIVVYDTATHLTSRLPASTAVVHVDPTVSNCPQVN